VTSEELFGMTRDDLGDIEALAEQIRSAAASLASGR
jgi:hypothetical protein